MGNKQKPHVFIGADHAGWEFKERVKVLLGYWKYEITDMGNADQDPDDDYPDFAFAVAQNVANIENALGILVCGSGQGMCMCANKVRGVRAALGWSPQAAKSSREHNNANVLCLPGGHLSKRQAEEVLVAWLNAQFSQGERHIRRLQKILDIELKEAKDASS